MIGGGVNKEKGLQQFMKHSGDTERDLWLPQGVEILVPAEKGHFLNLRRPKVGQTLAWGP